MTLRFNENSFKTLLGFTPYWDYKPTTAVHSDSPGVYTSAKILNLSIISIFHLKRDVIVGSVVNGIREPILFSFILDKPLGYKVFSQNETVNFKKKPNKSVLNTIAFYLKDSD